MSSKMDPTGNGNDVSSPPKHEEEGFEQAVKRRQTVKLEDWPNEAGVRHHTFIKIVRNILTL